MSKRILIGDLHFGIPSYNFILDKALMRIFNEKIFPYMKEHNITILDQLGDFTHDKKMVNKITAQQIFENFTSPLKLMNVTIICGNHDSYFRNNNSINSLRTLFNNTDFTIVDTEVVYKDQIAYVPWGIPFPPGARYIFTHAEVKGFEYQKGVVCKTGTTLEEYGPYDKVFAGHFHRKSQKKNFLYLGSLIGLNFGEVDSEHGFYVFDDVTGELQFIKSEIEVFKKVIYQNGANIDSIDFKDKVVSITVLENEDKLKYQQFLDKIYSQKPVDVKILSMESELRNIVDVEKVDGIENVLALSKKYIEGLELAKPMDTKTLYDIFERTYKEAIANG